MWLGWGSFTCRCFVSPTFVAKFVCLCTVCVSASTVFEFYVFVIFFAFLNGFVPLFILQTDTI